ncbi:MlaD family protein [[Mycobacterium] wendilense]|uniref:MlaD family protein n=1 Tax=[Mycobacterium] wendilense TaxID=3064284 RepID=A0ABM9MGI8_9MYCO|nr:MlaD family protein [Mycolicibacterium sp. MU0050]CAJ1584615.1 MlaD family protein [Mycolicibacterium sp. MU0050]
MIKPWPAFWRFALVAALTSVIFVLTVNVLRQPVAAETRSYTAEFSDISGLHADADVRIRGLRVGKVGDMRLTRAAGQSFAEVDFTLDRRYAVLPETRLLIKYQALTGLRYIDVVEAAEVDDPGDSLVTHIPLSMTRPSFDITKLFNGLQPVLDTLSPDDIDLFTANVASFLHGDGGGLGPMLDSIRTLTSFVSNRQEVVATLMGNLSEISTTFGGHSEKLVQILDWLNRPVDAALSVLDEFRKSELYGPAFTSAAVRLLENAGFRAGEADMDEGLDRAFTVLDDYSDAFKRVPVIWDNIEPAAGPEDPLPCSRGRAQLPETMDVLLNGQRVILCNQ